MTAILVILTILIAVALDIAIMAFRRRGAPVHAGAAPQPMLEPRPPQGIFLHPSHSWLRITTDGTLRVGLDDFLTESLGDLQIVQLPGRGVRVKRGAPLATLRSGKREFTVVAPADGEVVSVNERVLANPTLLANDPYGVGWLVGLWTQDHQEAIRDLRIGAGAAAFLRAEVLRLVDFLTSNATPRVGLMLADGGLPSRGAVAGLDEEGWEGFRRGFLAVEKTKE
jgi:glycine cleavage system H protein